MRTSPIFNDELMTYQLPPDGRVPFELLSTDYICASRQRSPTQTPGSPRLAVLDGEKVVLQFNENGHITKPWNNAPDKNSPGLVSIYGTANSSPTDTLLAIHNVWNRDGTGGDRKGVLLYQASFDDGMCYQYTDESSGYSAIEAERASQYPGPGPLDPAQGLNRWCTANLSVPNLPEGSIYTLFWVWDWPTTSNGGSIPQIYTTCVDLDVIG